MKCAFFTVTAAIGLVLFGQAARAAEPAYLDDRTDAAGIAFS